MSGVGEQVARVIIAETGGDMSRFPTPEHLASRAGVSPDSRESVGKRYPVRPPHGNKWLTAMLIEAAGSVGPVDMSHTGRITGRVRP